MVEKTEAQKVAELFNKKPVTSGQLEVVNKVDYATMDIKDIETWERQLALVKSIVAKDCSDDEFLYLIHQAKSYGLNPLRKEIWAVKFAGRPALVFAGRDGYLSIAHKSGKFGSMKTTFEFPKENNIGIPISATCLVFRKDYNLPFECTVFFNEYNSSSNPLWKKMPCVMLGKVAESSCLRRAFNISGLYDPSEMDNSGLIHASNNSSNKEIVIEKVDVINEHNSGE